jgi:hypothetical protein
MGIDDIGYQGNVPNQWDGPPAEVLKQYGLWWVGVRGLDGTRSTQIGHGLAYF